VRSEQFNNGAVFAVRTITKVSEMMVSGGTFGIRRAVHV